MSKARRPMFQMALSLVTLLIGASEPKQAVAVRDVVGVYYFPGWMEDLPQGQYRKPWEKIRSFPERKPLIGFYDDSDPNVMAKQLDYMSQGGISFVMFDWYYQNNSVMLDQAINAYLKTNQTAVKFAVMWCNQNKNRYTTADWHAMVDIWLDRYTKDSRYLKISGRPVVQFQSSDKLNADAKLQNSSIKEWLAWAQARAKERGLTGFYFVGNIGPMMSQAKSNGLSAVSIYNFNRGPGDIRGTHGYLELDNAYRRHWAATDRISTVPMIVPMISGWDRRPWGGSFDTLRDLSESTPEEFVAHLRAARTMMAQQVQGGNAYGIVCCWNEFGEGSYIEPTRGRGTTDIDAIRSVFSEK